MSEAKAKGAIPILVSTVRRNAWADGLPYDSYHEHPGAVRAVAAELGLPCIDLNTKGRELMIQMGPEYSDYFISNTYDPGVYPNYPNGNYDQVHFQELGALEMANAITEEIIRQKDSASLKELYSLLAPQYELKMHISDSSAGLVTRRATYPAGAPITLKARVNPENQFLKWYDLTNDQTITSSKMHTFQMPDAPMEIVGYFNEETEIGCDGEFSEATEDYCGFCTGGTTGLLPFTCTYTYDITNSCHDQTGYSFILTNPKELSERIGLEFTNGSSVNFTLSLYLNDQFDQEIIFKPTDDWNTSEKQVIEVALPTGQNLIELRDTKSIGLPEIKLLAWNADEVDIKCAEVLKAFASDDIQVHPNPTSRHLNVVIKNNAYSELRYSITNMDGQQVDSGYASDTIQLPSILAGIYLIQFHDKNQSLISTQKLLIQ